MANLDIIRGRQVVVPLTNKSGGGVIAGDVVIIDTANNDSFTTTTSAASTQLIGVVQETIANNATGRVLIGGYAPLVNVNASVTRGRYLFTHTVAKQAAENATYGSGAFGEILTSGTTPTAWLFGETAQSIGSVTSVAISGPSVITWSGTPITSSGTLTGTLANQSANTVLAGPTSGAAATPTFRALSAGDFPNIGCRVYNSAAQSISSGVNTVVTFDSENWDTNGFHSTLSSTGKLTIPTGFDGYYELFANLYWATSGGAYIRVNGVDATQVCQMSNVTGAALYSIYGQWHLVATDYVELIAFTGSTQNLNNFGTSYPGFGLKFLGT